MIAKWGNKDVLYLNEGTSGVGWEGFADRSDKIPIIDESRYDWYKNYSQEVDVADMNNDGWPDMVFSKRYVHQPAVGASPKNKLYLNLGTDGSGWRGFTDLGDSFEDLLPMEEGHKDCPAGALCDFDGDGDADIVFGFDDSGAPQELYLSRMAEEGSFGVFLDRSDLLPASATGHPTYSFAVGDVDLDGDPDVVVGNIDWLPFRQPTTLYLNLANVAGGWEGFVNAGPSNMPLLNEGTMDVALEDIDGDQDLDLVTAHDGGPNRVLINTGAP